MVWDDAARQKAQATIKANKAARAAAKEAGTVEPSSTPPHTTSIAAPKVEVAMTHPETGMAVPKKAVPEQAKVPEPLPEAPPKNLFSGFVKKLEVFGLPGADPNKPIPGYELYWFNDEKNYVQMGLSSGWALVEKDEVALNDAVVSPGNNDLGNHVRRLVGTTEGDKPLYAYLMKKPDWLHEHHMREREVVHQRQEEQLRSGTFNPQGDKQYSKNRLYDGSPSNLPSITIGTSTVIPR